MLQKPLLLVANTLDCLALSFFFWHFLVDSYSVLFLLYFFCCFESQVCVFWLLFHSLFGPPHLALNPPYFCFGLFCFSFAFFGGFKGQVKWPEGPTHLDLDPPFFSVLLFKRQKHLFPPKKSAFLLVCCVSTLLSPQPFFTSPVDSLSFGLLMFCLSFFLSWLLFLSFISLLFLSLCAALLFFLCFFLCWNNANIT